MLKWIGGLMGFEGLPGVPGRNLSQDEVEQYGGKEALLETGLYVEDGQEGKARKGGGSENKLARGASHDKTAEEQPQEDQDSS